MRRIVAILAVTIGCASGQSTKMGSRTMVGDWDATGAASTKPMKSGTALPAGCAAGETYFRVDAGAGQNLYLCNPDNVWTQVSGGASHVVTFDGATAALADGSTVAWNCGSGSGAQCTASWTVPAGVRWVRAQLWAAGGGGAGSAAGDRNGTGGGGGGYADLKCAVTPGAVVAIKVGVAGAGSAGALIGGNGGDSAFGACASVLGGLGGRDNNTGGGGGRLSGSPINPILTYSYGAFNGIFDARSPLVTGPNTPGSQAARIDQGGWGAGQANAGNAGLAGGAAIGGGGGGASGGYNNASGGAGGTSAIGGAGGNGGGWTAAGGYVNCTAGAAPGGGGGGAGIEAAGGNAHTGCNGGRGEVRLYYVK